MTSLLLSLERFNAYIQGASSNSLKIYMRGYDYKKKLLKKDFRRTTVSANADVIRLTQELLKNLNIPEDEWGIYKSDLTIYDFLIKLSQQGYSQVDYILHLIDKKNRRFNKLDIALSGGLALLLLGQILSIPNVASLLITAAQGLLESMIGIPIIALIFTCGATIYELYQTYGNKKKTIQQHLHDNLFLSLESLTKIIGQSFLIAAGGTMSPAIAILFVFAALVDASKELSNLFQYYNQYKNSPPISENDNLSVHKAYARRVFGFQQHRNALVINLLAAVAVVGIMAVWCFIPGVLYVTIAALAALALAYAVRTALLKVNELILREHLQNQLAELDGKYDEETIYDPEFTPNDIPLTDFTEAASEQDNARFLPEPQTFSAGWPFFNGHSTTQDKGKKKEESYLPQEDFSEEYLSLL